MLDFRLCFSPPIVSAHLHSSPHAATRTDGRNPSNGTGSALGFIAAAPPALGPPSARLAGEGRCRSRAEPPRVRGLRRDAGRLLPAAAPRKPPERLRACKARTESPPAPCRSIASIPGLTEGLMLEGDRWMSSGPTSLLQLSHLGHIT